jgi:hypothetical protein
MKPIRIKWQTHQNPFCETLHCDVKLPYVSTHLDRHTDETPEADELADFLLAIPGVDHIYAQGYAMTVTRGDVFDWDEIRPQVEKALLAFARACDLVRVET